MAVNRLSLAKFFELLLALACLGLHVKSMGETELHTRLLVAGTFVGFIIILVGVFAGYLLSTPVNKRIDIFYSLVGCALFVASGVLIIQEWEDAFIKDETRKYALAKGSLAIVNGALFFLDAIFTFRD